MGLGSYPAVTLAQARERAADARKLIATGHDPIEARKAAGRARKAIPTFQEVARAVIEGAQAKSRNPKVRYQWERHLGPAYCAPLLDRPVNEITTTEVAKVLKPVWVAKPEVARKLLPAIRRVFEHARVVLRDEHGIAARENPANWADLKGLGFESPKMHSRGKHPHLAYSDVPSFMAALRKRSGVAARALEFLILTNVRTGSVLAAEWGEFDLKDALWLIPPAHLKDGHHRSEPMRVPLTGRAVEILQQMQDAATGQYVFPGQRRGKPLSQMAMLVLLRKMNTGPDGVPIWRDPVQRRPIVPHGFRATFRTWAEECTSARMLRSRRRWAIRSAPRLNGLIVVPISSRNAASSWRSGRHSAAGHTRRSSASLLKGGRCTATIANSRRSSASFEITGRPPLLSQGEIHRSRTERGVKTS